jgi:hypothetical protein
MSAIDYNKHPSHEGPTMEPKDTSTPHWPRQTLKDGTVVKTFEHGTAVPLYDAATNRHLGYVDYVFDGVIWTERHFLWNDNPMKCKNTYKMPIDESIDMPCERDEHVIRAAIEANLNPEDYPKCSECGTTIGFGSYPFCPHGRSYLAGYVK